MQFFTLEQPSDSSFLNHILYHMSQRNTPYDGFKRD